MAKGRENLEHPKSVSEASWLEEILGLIGTAFSPPYHFLVVTMLWEDFSGHVHECSSMVILHTFSVAVHACMIPPPCKETQVQFNSALVQPVLMRMETPHLLG